MELESGGTKALNYTPWYIHTFEISGPPGTRIGGGGPNVMPVGDDGRPSGGGKETCCTSFPVDWQPDLKLTVRWLVEKTKDGKTPGYWYKAENVRIPRYDGSQVGGVWGIFLPGDRVCAPMGRIPSHVWEDLTRKREAQASGSSTAAHAGKTTRERGGM